MSRHVHHEREFFSLLLRPWMILSFLCVPVGHSALAAADQPGRTIPARPLPPPGSASPVLRGMLSHPSAEPDLKLPERAEDWAAFKALLDQPAVQQLEALRSRYKVTVRPETIGGVATYLVTPPNLDAGRRDKVILYMHPGGFIWGGGEFGTACGIEIAAITGYKVVVVDYGLLPNRPFPAPIDDGIAVYKGLLERGKASTIAIAGGSVGGGLALAVVQRANAEGLSVPGAMVAISPSAADLSKTSDSYFANAGVDGEYDGFWESVFKSYANGHALTDPGVSPVYGDFSRFPPSLLVTGTAA